MSRRPSDKLDSAAVDVQPDTVTGNDANIDPTLVARLVAAQFPQWRDLSITPVEPNGWDNRTYRLGDLLSVRLPSAERYAHQVEKEHRWLPFLSPPLPLPIPVPVAMGDPAFGYPWHWSIYRWIDGVPAASGGIADLREFARELGAFVAALERIDPSDGPRPGPHNFFRGGPLMVYDDETRRAIEVVRERRTSEARQRRTSEARQRRTSEARQRRTADSATEVWEAAISAPWRGSPVWVHGDVSTGNLLLKEGRLSAVIDFGCLGVGDPACDLAIAWTLFKGPSREAFRSALPLDRSTWARGRGWALWKALTVLAGHAAVSRRPQGEERAVPRVEAGASGGYSSAKNAWRVIDEVIDDYKRSS